MIAGVTDTQSTGAQGKEADSSVTVETRSLSPVGSSSEALCGLEQVSLLVSSCLRLVVYALGQRNRDTTGYPRGTCSMIPTGTKVNTCSSLIYKAVDIT